MHVLRNQHQINKGAAKSTFFFLKLEKKGQNIYRTIKVDHKLPWNINFLWMKWWLLIIEPSSHFLPTQQAYPQRATPHDPKDLLQTSCVHALTGQSATSAKRTYIHENTNTVITPQQTTGPLCSAHMVRCRKRSMSAEGMNRVSSKTIDPILKLILLKLVNWTDAKKRNLKPTHSH